MAAAAMGYGASTGGIVIKPNADGTATGLAATGMVHFDPVKTSFHTYTRTHGRLEMGPSEHPDLLTHHLNAKPTMKLTEEEKVDRAVAQRRQAELERRARIFDAKTRTIGIPKQTLDQQVAERAEDKHFEKLEKQAFDTSLLRVNQQLKMMEIDKQRMQREMEAEAKDFSLKHLNFEARREYDLNDPDFKKKDLPSRVGDNDPRCGPSSMQQFTGEDLMQGERKRQQHEQQKSWIEQQKFEKAMMKDGAKQESDAFAAQVDEITRVRNEMEAEEAATRRDMEGAQQRVNLHKAQENAQLKAIHKHDEESANAKELLHHATDPMLNETGAHHFPDGKKDKQNYKGSTRAERMMLSGLQKDQMDENAYRKAMEQHEQRLFEQQAENTRKTLVAMEREKQRTRRAMKQQMAQDNHHLRDEQYKAQKHLSTEIYTNAPSDEFFGQFGSTTR